MRFFNCKTGEGYEDEAGYCSSVRLEQIKQRGYFLTLGRYVGTSKEEDDGEPFMDKMERLTTRLKGQFEQSSKLEAEVKKNLAGLGYSP